MDPNMDVGVRFWPNHSTLSNKTGVMVFVGWGRGVYEREVRGPYA